MAAPLNPTLYRMLQKLFGEVKVSSEGQPFCAKVVRDPLDPSKRKLDAAGGFGEYYQVCCPHCKDRRFRLWFNHRYGANVAGMDLKRLFVCYNEHCESDQKFSQWVSDHLKPYVLRDIAGAAPAGQMPGTATPTGMTPVTLPESTPVHMLAPDHPAVIYLAGRGYDVQDLGATFDVRWCESAPVMPPHNRILFPVYAENASKQIVCYGFQARYFDPVRFNDKPDKAAGEVKWFTYRVRVAQLLYNTLNARGSPVVMSCEGPLDVPSCGAKYSVATFGKKITHVQRDILWKTWGQHGAVLVLAYDPDAWDLKNKVNRSGAERLMAMEFEMSRSWACVVRLDYTGLTDPGATGFKRNWEMVLEALRARPDRKHFMQVAQAVGAVTG